MREIKPPAYVNEARYSVAEVAHYLHMSKATLRTWVKGRNYTRKDGQQFSPPIIEPAALTGPRPVLSFANLVEAYVVRSLRVTLKVDMHKVRRALDTAQEQYGIDRLLLSPQLLAAPGHLFLETYLGFVELGQDKSQHSIREVFEARLRRLVFENEIPASLYPIVRHEDGGRGPRVVMIRPQVSFGRPVVQERRIRTATIAGRFLVGESVTDIAEDYSLGVEAIEEAIRYEAWSESSIEAA